MTFLDMGKFLSGTGGSAKTSSGWTAGTVSPTVAASSPEIVGQILNDPRLASKGTEANVSATAPDVVKTAMAQQDGWTNGAMMGDKFLMANGQLVTDVNGHWVLDTPGNRRLHGMTDEPLAPTTTTSGMTGWQMDGGLKDAVVAGGNPKQSGMTAIGWLNYVSQNPVTADQLTRAGGATADPRLESKVGSLTSPLRGIRETAAQVSAFRTSDAPTEILKEITNLNENQGLRRAAYNEMLNKLFGAAESNSNYAEALRGAVVQPGSSVSYGSRILSGREMGANAQQAGTVSRMIDTQRAQIGAAQQAQRNYDEAMRQRQAMGEAPSGWYVGSSQEKLDKKIEMLRQQTEASSATQQRGIKASGVSGWNINPIY
jgi:hypothetical protein